MLQQRQTKWRNRGTENGINSRDVLQEFSYHLLNNFQWLSDKQPLSEGTMEAMLLFFMEEFVDIKKPFQYILVIMYIGNMTFL